MLELSDLFDRRLLLSLLGQGSPGGESDSEGKSNAGESISSTLSPVEVVFNAFRNQSNMNGESKDLGPQQHCWVKSSEVLARLPAIVSLQVEASSSSRSLSTGPGTGTGSLLRWTLVQLEDFLYQHQLSREWASASSSSTSSISVDQLHDSGFHRLWSTLSFLFCITESINVGGSQSSDSQHTLSPQSSSHSTVNLGGAAGVGSGTITNEAEFGHGFTVAGCTLLHLLGQTALFDAMDISKLVMSLQAQDDLKRLLDKQQEPYFSASGLAQVLVPLKDFLSFLMTFHFIT